MQEPYVHLPDLEATKRLGVQLALNWLLMPDPKPILLLEGDLGAGKTSLVKGIAQGLKIDEPITSPTFSLSQHYRGLLGALAHLDLYRLELPSLADELFCQEEEEARAIGAFLAVEWPGRLGFRPEDSWILHLELIDPDNPDAGRVASIHCY